MGMPSSRAQRRQFAVDVSEELRRCVPADQVANAIAQLRSAGADCWVCGGRVDPHEQSALQLHVTSVAGRLGLTHARCARSGVFDDRGSRSAALHTQERLLESSTDMLAFLSFRSLPAPRAVVVLSPLSPVRYQLEQGSLTLAVHAATALGMQPVAPPVIDAVPAANSQWSVWEPSKGRLLVECGSIACYEGEVSDLPQWSEAVGAEGNAMVLLAGIGLPSSVAGSDTWRVLDRFAHQGLVVGVTANAASAEQQTVTAHEVVSWDRSRNCQ